MYVSTCIYEPKTLVGAFINRERGHPGIIKTAACLLEPRILSTPPRNQ